MRRGVETVNVILQDLLVAAGLLAMLLFSLEVGFRAGRRVQQEPDARAGGVIGSVQGATLGLLGLLLAFSFSAAGSRFLDRQDLITTEANAIGTALLRADLLDPEHRAELRDALRDYTEYRVDFTSQAGKSIDTEVKATLDAQHARIWKAAMGGVTAKPDVMLGVLPPVNEVIDVHSLRVAAGKKHIPKLVMGLLIAASVLSIGCMGFSSGLGGRRRAALTVPLALLIGTSLWITIDLDHPREGLLRLSDAPLKALNFEEVPPGAGSALPGTGPSGPGG
jgi:hypothetical protein